jgi:hypothetical protein
MAPSGVEVERVPGGNLNLPEKITPLQVNEGMGSVNEHASTIAPLPFRKPRLFLGKEGRIPG